MKRLNFFIILSTLIITACAQNTGSGSAGITIIRSDSIEIPDTIPNYLLLGQYDPAKEEGFTRIADQYTTKSNIYIRIEAYEAFLAMRDSAKNDGISLTIVSATRTFEMQKWIWEGKWNGKRRVEGKYLNVAYPDPTERALAILRYSSMPGTSRHHWGTDIDINSVVPSYFQTAQGKKELAWLETNANYFGYYRPYTEYGENRQTGYQPEEWHWSYLPLAVPLQNAYKRQIQSIDIKGFDGDEAVFATKVISNYVFGIDRSCFILPEKFKQ